MKDAEIAKITARIEKEYEDELLKAFLRARNEVKAKIADFIEKHGKDYKNVSLIRLRNLESNIEKEIRKLNTKSANILMSAIRDIYKTNYYSIAYGIETTVGVSLNFGLLSVDAIKAIVNSPLNPIKWSERNLANQAVLNRQIKEELTQGLIQGEGYAKTAKRINERFNVGAGKALRIARTENHRAQNQGLKDGVDRARPRLEKIGLEIQRVWDATLDSRTRSEHRSLDGQIANENDKFIVDGIEVDAPGNTGIPSHDINCRCIARTQIPGYGPKVRRDNQAKKLIAYKTYSQWAEDRIN